MEFEHVETPTIPDAAPPETRAPALAVDPALREAVEALDGREQEVLLAFLTRAASDRATHGPLDETALIVNGLKAYRRADDWMAFLRVKEKKAPALWKHFPDAEHVPLEVEEAPPEASLAATLAERSSGRDYVRAGIPFARLGTLLHEACGVRGSVVAYNRPSIPLRRFPSAGGLQCIDVYAVVNDVEGLAQGLYHYNPFRNALARLERGSYRRRVTECCPNHDWLAEAAVVLFLVPDLARLSWKYGYQSYRLAHLDAGIVAQSLHLVATALELASCMVFGFTDDAANALLGLDGRDEFTALLLAVGTKARLESLRTNTPEKL